MYGTGVQNDRFGLMLADSSLFLTINLGKVEFLPFLSRYTIYRKNVPQISL